MVKRSWLYASLGLGASGAIAAVTIGSALAPHGTSSPVIERADVALWSDVKDALSNTIARGRALLEGRSTFLSLSDPDQLRSSAVRWISEWSADPRNREVLVAWGGPNLVEWLVEQACFNSSSHHTFADQALCNLVRKDAAGESILNQRGVVPALIKYVATGHASTALLLALQEATLEGDLGYQVAVSDIRQTLLQLHSEQGSAAQLLAASFLSAWAGTSIASRRKLAAAGAHQTVAEVAAAATADHSANRPLLQQLIKMMRAMTNGPVGGEQQCLELWVSPLLYITADASALQDDRLAADALAALRACLSCGGWPVHNALAATHPSPFLMRLHQGGGPQLRQEVARLVGLLAEQRVLEAKDWDLWAASVLRALPNPAGDAEDRQAAAAALQGLASAPGNAGLHVSYCWLATLLDALATGVNPYTAVPYMPHSQDPKTWVDAVPVVPSYAKWLASQLRVCYEPPDPSPEHKPPRLMTLLIPGEVGGDHVVEARTATAADVADALLCAALEVLCALVADDPSRQLWVSSAGALPLLHRLTLERSEFSDVAHTPPSQALLLSALSGQQQQDVQAQPGQNVQQQQQGAQAQPAQNVQQQQQDAQVQPGPNVQQHQLPQQQRRPEAGGRAGDDSTGPALLPPSPQHQQRAKQLPPHAEEAAPMSSSASARQAQPSLQQSARPAVTEAASHAGKAAAAAANQQDIISTTAAAASTAGSQMASTFSSVPSSTAAFAWWGRNTPLAASSPQSPVPIKPDLTPRPATSWWWSRPRASTEGQVASTAVGNLAAAAAVQGGPQGPGSIPASGKQQQNPATTSSNSRAGWWGRSAPTGDSNPGKGATSPEVGAAPPQTAATPHAAAAKQQAAPDMPLAATATPQPTAAAPLATAATPQPATEAAAATRQAAATIPQATAATSQPRGTAPPAAIVVPPAAPAARHATATAPQTEDVIPHGAAASSHATATQPQATAAQPQTTAAQPQATASSLSPGLFGGWWGGSSTSSSKPSTAQVPVVTGVPAPPGPATTGWWRSWRAAPKPAAGAVQQQAEGAAAVHATTSAEQLSLGDAEVVAAVPVPLCVQQQTARLLALLALQPAAASAMVAAGWLPWLRSAAVAHDCLLSSHAGRALLHLEADPDLAGEVREAGAPAPPISRQALSGGSAGHRPVFLDGVHLVDPTNSHHLALARAGRSGNTLWGVLRRHGWTLYDDPQGVGPLPVDVLEPPQEPDFDLVLVHGIRGGPFITWRREQHANRQTLDRASCWPSAWLAKDFPGARLLSVEYPAPMFGWEGQSMPVRDTAVRVMRKLAAAGVGTRPVVFVVHSMGGIVAKEFLASALAEGPNGPHYPLVTATRAIAFYSTPHFGSNLAAVGWQLRHVPGASPAPCLAHLAPGPHLDELNEVLRHLHEAGGVAVLNLLEGRTTSVAGGITKMMVVPTESGYPGFGELLVLPDEDHIDVCKPRSKEDVAYTALVGFIMDHVKEARQAPRLSPETESLAP